MESTSPKICIVGAGFSGLCMAIKLKTDLDFHTFTVYEACEDVGGTWFANTYPGCACDVPSHLYSFSFSPKPDWSHHYAYQPEIFGYLKEVTNKFDIYPHIRFQTKVECLRWNENENKWHASIKNIRSGKDETAKFDIIINGTGKLRIPHYPKEYLGFEGPILHSAEWNHSIPLEGKRVAVIGTGASAIQIISAIADKVETLQVFQRKAPYIIPRTQFAYPSGVKWAFSNIPGVQYLTRAALFLWHELLFGATRYESFTNRVGAKVTELYRKSQIKDVTLLEKVTPSYTFVCKRILISESYYKTLTKPNVILVTDKIDSVSGNKIRTVDGKKFELDVLILGTGYQPHDFFSPMKVYGKDGVDVLEKWKVDRPQGYLGVASRDMPNFFTLLGPYSALGHNSNIFNIECQVHWTILAIKEMLKRGAKSITLKRKPEVEFLNDIDKEMENTVWVLGQCEPWYFDKEGRNTTLWPGNQFEYWEKCKSFDSNMFEFA